MKVALLSGASSIHTIRWANGLANKGIEVHLLTQHEPLEILDDRVRLYLLPYKGNIGYFRNVKVVKRILKQISPNIVNAHYASGYATTARLVNYRPWILSIWGSDVYDFPFKTFMHKYLVQRNLLAADCIASTSYCMAEHTMSLIPNYKKEIEITPFGVDIEYYSDNSTPLRNLEKSDLVIGTVKVIAYKYGIDVLIKSFKIVVDHFKDTDDSIYDKLKLRIVGDGPQKEEYEKLCIELGLHSKVDFVGRVNSDDVPKYLNEFDIFVALSRLDSESFGVAIIEAGAAGRPVVVSNVGGLPEVVVNEVTGYVVEKESPALASEKLIELINNKEKRIAFGEAGFEHVQKEYDWDFCLGKMIRLYDAVITS